MEEIYYGNADRSVKELLQITLDNKRLFKTGLCYWVFCLFVENIINYSEYKCILKYIKSNRPSKYSSLNSFLSQDSPYYWKDTNINPRIKWIKKHIKNIK
jgi:hypothetical protein